MAATFAYGAGGALEVGVWCARALGCVWAGATDFIAAYGRVAGLDPTGVGSKAVDRSGGVPGRRSVGREREGECGGWDRAAGSAACRSVAGSVAGCGLGGDVVRGADDSVEKDGPGTACAGRDLNGAAG